MENNHLLEVLKDEDENLSELFEYIEKITPAQLKAHILDLLDRQRQESAEKANVYWHTRDFTSREKAPIIRKAKIVCEIDKQSILNAKLI